MARITGPVNSGIPGFNVSGVQIDVPVDLPEGGHLCVIVGDNPMGIPVPSIALPKGCMVGVIPAQVAEQIRPHIAAALEKLEQMNASRLSP